MRRIKTFPLLVWVVTVVCISNSNHLMSVTNRVKEVSPYSCKEYHDLDIGGNDCGYDDYGDLVCVVPPLLADHVGGTATYLFDGDTWLKDYAYCYRYDYRNRCVQKRLPGCEWVYQVYDKADRLVLTQDGNQRTHDKWTSYKYDRLGRLVYTAEIADTKPFSQLLSDFAGWLVVEEFSTQGHEHEQRDTGYSKSFYHLAETDLLTVNYYDSYDFLELLDGQTKNRLAYAAEDGYGEQYPNATGLLTGTRTYLLDGSGQYLATAYYYDYRGRVVQARSTNIKQGYNISFFAYDFAGNLLRSRTEYTSNKRGISAIGTPVIDLAETYRHTYDHAGRLTDTYHQVDGQPEVQLAHNEYDEAGRLVTKKQHNNQNTVNYAYNIRNWVTDIHDGGFAEELAYERNVSGMLVQPGYFNGNVFATHYTSNGQKESYYYNYDGLDRLTSAAQSIIAAIGAGNAYKEKFEYDKHGNILSLERYAQNKDLGGSIIKKAPVLDMSQQIDALTLDYDGNKLVTVTDAQESDETYGPQGIPRLE